MKSSIVYILYLGEGKVMVEADQVVPSYSSISFSIPVTVLYPAD